MDFLGCLNWECLTITVFNLAFMALFHNNFTSIVSAQIVIDSPAEVLAYLIEKKVFSAYAVQHLLRKN